MSGLTIPFNNLSRQYNKLRDQLLSVTDEVYQTGQVLDGPCAKQFESAVAIRCNRKYAVAVNSCTTALELAIRATWFHFPNVYIPSISFPATLNSVLMAKAQPIYMDVDEYGQMNFNTLYFDRGIPKIVMPVNLYGNVCDYDRLSLITDFFAEANELFVIEDNAQSFGATYKGRPAGSFGHFSCLSFDPTKNLPNYGSGGMILTDSQNLYQTILSLHNNGKASGHGLFGTNSKMSEADCAQMLVKLSYFDGWQKRRENIAEYYTDKLQDFCATPMVAPHCTHAWHKYVIRTEGRDIVKKLLHGAGIETKIHYEKPLHLLDISHSFNPPVNVQAEAYCNRALSLPIYPELTDGEVEYIAESTSVALRRILN